jgi:uncharacterized protein YsxB (DUF464 family)
MPRAPEETTSWVAERLRKVQCIQSVTISGPHALSNKRDDVDAVLAGVISTMRVTVDALEALIAAVRYIEIVTNVPEESVWEGGAIKWRVASDLIWRNR